MRGSSHRRARPAAVALALLLPAGAAMAQDCDYGGSVRLRHETVQNQPRAGLLQNEQVVNLRTTLSATCRSGPVRFVGELYDSRVYGDEPGSAVGPNEVNVFEPVQAYVGVDFAEPFGRPGKASLAVGRMMLNLGSRRLVAADDYRNTTNSYTGLRADLALKTGFSVTAILVSPQMRLPDNPDGVRANRFKLDRESGDALLWGGIVGAPSPAGAVEASYFGFRERDAPGRPTRDRRLSTFALRLFRDPAAGRLDYDVEAIGQTGTVSESAAATARRLDVAAGFVHAEAGYQLANSWKTRLAAEVDWASGDRPGGKFGRFDTLFGMRRAELAPSGILAAVGRTNVLMPGVRLEIAPGSRLDAFVAVHRLLLDSATDSFSTSGVRDPSGRAGRDAGDLLDSRVRYWLVPKTLRLEADYALIAKGRFLRAAPNAPPGGDTHYLSLNATWSF